jgi:hypothetical protein
VRSILPNCSEFVRDFVQISVRRAPDELGAAECRLLLLRRFRRQPCSVAAQWVSVLCRQLFSALGANDCVLRLACGENEEAEQSEEDRPCCLAH